MESSFCLGTTVTSSISHRKATSEGTSPWGRGNAMVDVDNFGCFWRSGWLKFNSITGYRLQWPLRA